MKWPANFLGDYTDERSVLLAYIQEQAAKGGQVAGVHVLVGEDLVVNNLDYWVMQLGRIVSGKFKLIGREIPIDGALSRNVVRRHELKDPLLLSRGDLLALRMSPRGQPAPIVGLSVALEWGIHATRGVNRG